MAVVFILQNIHNLANGFVMKVNQKLTDMIKRISHLVILYIFLLGSAVILQSCCDEESIRIIGDGDMSIYNSDANSTATFEDDITGSFAVYLAPETVISDVTEFGFMNSAYAFSCDYNFANSIMPESLVLTCDKAFELGDMTIEAGTDLLVLEGVETPGNNVSGIQDALISFTETFTDQAVFEEAEYTFTINMSTDDGLDIANSASAFFRL